jgi:hypothetical protein
MPQFNDLVEFGNQRLISFGQLAFAITFHVTSEGGECSQQSSAEGSEGNSQMRVR